MMITISTHASLICIAGSSTLHTLNFGSVFLVLVWSAKMLPKQWYTQKSLDELCGQGHKHFQM